MSNHPDSVETSESLISALTLAMVPGVGPITRQRLLEQFGTPAAVLSAAPSDLQKVPRVGSKLCRAISTARQEIDAQAEIELCRRSDIDIVLEQDEAYPRRLRDLPDPPGVLFVRGKLQPSDALAIAIVGSRHATH